MNKTVFLHLGLHKTGSTSIQFSCAANRDKLYRAGILYPTFKTPKGKEVVNHSTVIYSLFSEAPENYLPNIVQQLDIAEANTQYMAQLNAYLYSPVQSLILSGEGISKLSYPELYRFKTYIESAGWQIQAFCYIRSPASYICSSYAQKIKSAGPFEGIIPNRCGIMNLKAVFPDIAFYPYHQIATQAGGSMVAHFLKRVGFKHPETFKTVYMNPSLSNAAIRLMAYIHAVYPKIIQGQLSPVHQKPYTEVFAKITGDPFCFTSEEYTAVQTKLGVENSWYYDYLGPAFCDQPQHTPIQAFSWQAAHLSAFKAILGELPRAFQLAAYAYFKDKAGLTHDEWKDLEIRFLEFIDQQTLDAEYPNHQIEPQNTVVNFVQALCDKGPEHWQIYGHLGLGILCFQNKKFKLARDYFTRVIQQDPTLNKAYFYLVQTCLQLRDSQGAKKYLELVKQHYPKHSGEWADRGVQGSFSEHPIYLKHLILHIGLSKTGTSALQSWFSRHYLLLGQRGIYYPDLAPRAKYESTTSGNGQPLYRACLTGDRHHIKTTLLTYYQGVHQTTLISNEHFQELDKRQLSQLKAVCVELGIQCTVIAYVRSMYEKIYSNYLQRVKRHGEVQSFEAFIKNHNMKREQSLLLNHAAVWGDALQVLNYDAVKHHLCQSFARAIHLDTDGVNLQMGKVNRSLTQGETQLLITLNKLHQGVFSTKISDYILQAYPDKNTTIPYSEAYLTHLNQEAQEAVDVINQTFLIPNRQPEIQLFCTQEDKVEAAQDTDFDHQIVVEWCLQEHGFKGEKRFQFVNFLRDLAVFLEPHDLVSSFELMRKAYALRPQGAFIQKKLKQYMKMLQQRNERANDESASLGS